jgi:hypothetical protein
LCRNYAGKSDLQYTFVSAKRLQSRSVKVGFYQQKLEKLKPEKRKRENGNLPTDSSDSEQAKQN